MLCFERTGSDNRFSVSEPALQDKSEDGVRLVGGSAERAFAVRVRALGVGAAHPAFTYAGSGHDAFSLEVLLQPSQHVVYRWAVRGHGHVEVVRMNVVWKVHGALGATFMNRQPKVTPKVQFPKEVLDVSAFQRRLEVLNLATGPLDEVPKRFVGAPHP